MENDLLKIWEAGWVLAMLRGAAVTIGLSMASIALGAAIGIVCGLVKWAKVFPLTLLVDFYTSIVRGVPELLIIYLLFFSSVDFMTQVAAAFGYQGLEAGFYAFTVAVIAVAAIAGAYSTEVIRGALSSIPAGQLEAARALGMPKGRIFIRIIMPQMLRIAVPGMNNVWQTTIKDTALVSVVGLQELMRVAFVGAGSTRHPFIFYLAAALVYLTITLVSQGGLDQIERRFRSRARGQEA